MIIDSFTTFGPTLRNHAERRMRPFDDTVSPEGLVAVLDRVGVDRAVVFAPRWVGGPVSDPTYEIANRAVFDAVERFPDRLIGYARVNPNYGDAAIAEAKRCFDDYAFKGLMLDPEWENFDPSDEALVYPLAELVRERGLVTLVESGYSPANPGAFWELANRFPETPLILGHMGGRLTVDAVTIAKRSPNVYLETSDHMLFLGNFVSDLGAERFLYGSNTPFAVPEVEMHKITREKFSDEQRDLILGGNAARLHQLN